MKTFQQFILEAYDPEIQGRSQIRKQGQGGRVGAERKKSEPEKRRVKAVGGGKTAPAKDYKDQGFSYNKEQQAQYDKLRQLRYERVSYFLKNGIVSKGGLRKKEVEVTTEDS